MDATQALPNTPQPAQQSGGVSLDFTKAQPITPAPDNSQPGVSLDFSKAQPVAGTTPPASDEIQINPEDSLLTKGGKALGATLEGVGEGVFGTAAGASDILDRTTGMQPGAVNSFLHRAAGDNNASHGAFQTVGQVGETVGEFLMGDEALKGLALSERLAKSAKIAKVLESSPLAAKAFEIGVNALRGGVAQGVISGVKDASENQGVRQGLLAAGLTGAFGVGGESLKAIRSALDVNGIQAPLQSSLRDILSDVADKNGAAKPTAPSIRDAAQQVADSLKAKASGLYQTLDNISGGQAQRFRDAAKNVSDKLGEIVGLDDEKEADLVARQAEIEAAHKKMLDTLEAKGYDRNMLAQADAVWKQQSALSDLSNSIRQSTNGLRPELVNGAKATPETVNPKTLFTKLNRLNDRGRLAQAIGQDNADALLQHVDAAYLSAQKIAAKSKWLGYLAKATGFTGAGALGVHIAHDVLSSGQ